MNYIHIKNLEKYHPGYKDRVLQWAKIYFKMAQGDPDVEMINEIDWGRLIKLILLELQAKTPIPINDDYLIRKGFDIKIRPISLTINMLHNFLDVVTQSSDKCHIYIEKSNIEKSNIEKSNIEKNNIEKSNIKKSKKRVTEKSVTPTLQECKFYFQELRFKEEAVAFYDYFQSNGWKVGGKANMKDWKAAARNWTRRSGKPPDRIIEPSIKPIEGPPPPQEFLALKKKL